MERIISAAIRWNGTVQSVPMPGRHHDVIRHIVDNNPACQTVIGEQGFISGDGATQGRFVTREEARKIAEAAGQLIASDKDADGVPFVRQHSQLFSEDVW